MKIKICDICYYEDDELIMSTWRIGKKNGATSFRIDVCDKHKNWMKNRSIKQAEEDYNKLLHPSFPDIKDVNSEVIGDLT